MLALAAFIFISLWHQTRELAVFPSYAKNNPNENTQARNGHEDNDILNDAQQHRARTRRFNDTMQTLESLDLRFYVYDEPMIRRNGIHNLALVSPGRKLLKKRFVNDARAEIDIIRTLGAHPLRTSDPNNASIFVIPISTAAHIIMRERTQWATAVGNLTDTPVFQRTGGNRHLMVSLSQQGFDYGSTDYVSSFGMEEEKYAQLWNLTIARESDPFESVAMADRGEGGDFARLFREKAPVTSHAFSIGLMMGMNKASHSKRGGGQNMLQYQPATYDKLERSSNFLFYHTRQEGSGFNSTIYRHVLVNATMNDENNLNHNNNNNNNN